MKNVNSCEEKFVFCDHLQKVYDDMLARIKPHCVRGGTFTGPEPDGKTPFLDTFEKYPDEIYELTLAHAIVQSWKETDPVIHKGDLLVGVPRPVRPIKEHFSMGIQVSIEDFDDGPWAARAEEYKTRCEKLMPRMVPATLDDMNNRQREIFGISSDDPAFHGLWWTGGYQGHTVPNYQKLLDLGLDGLLSEIEDSVSVHGNNAVLRACRVIVEGMSEWILMYADEAERQAETADGDYKKLLKKIAEVCRNISHKAPETLHEACQLMWFYCLWDWVDCIGRYDQYMYPFYKKAREEDEAYADTLIAASMIKFREHGIHNITVSGVDPKTGKESTSELTYLILQILRLFRDSHPKMTVRIGEDTPHDLIMLVVQIWSEGMCDPSVASDKLIIDSFVKSYGVPIDDARDYSLLGCQEIEIPGRSNFGCEDGMLSLIKILEYTLNNGANRFDKDSKLVGLPTGHITDYETYEDFEEAYFKQIDYFVKPFCELCNMGAEVRAKNFSKLVKTVCTDDCIKKGMSLDDGGSRYNFGCVETAGLTAAADSLYAIKKAVFEDKTVSAQELEDAIAANFEGHEETQRILESIPKFGNDNKEVDEIARRVLEHFWAEIGKYKTFRGDEEFLGACSLLGSGTAYGLNTWACADGRRTGEPLGNTIGPVSGKDVSGLTAMLNSVAHLDLHRGLGGTTCNVRIPKSTIRTPEDREKIACLMKAFLMNGGMLAQITTADLDELKDAQIHPEKHNDLLVRVGGFSIYFNQLERIDQDEIILRYDK